MANRLDEALKAVSEGSFKPDREKDELTYALGTPKHTGRVRGMGVVPWKHGFSADIETYRSRSRKKAGHEYEYVDVHKYEYADVREYDYANVHGYELVET